MRTFVAVVTAILAAALAPALAFVSAAMALNGKGLGSSEDIISFLALVGFCMLFAIAHAVILGLPVSLWLLRTNKFVLRSMLLAGSLIGSVPIALLANSLLRSDWIDYLQLVFNAGALGIIGSTAFYFTFQGINSNNSFKPKPLRGSA
ncbi:hypothetical protein [Pseudoxanthomonas sp. JBR18]|uniref:hypothetical protein n=1 Tax=Pseudoxanthomonas sp. JBR18 TaxID=2969308 RepID=UPI0023057CDD|nr:hypothetical protein [Pseudoxanthomonas sp. JBR18]WCE05522.1 hypothetical protein PJ250_06060 [Pseudoxanthomonas sp. JBR18]WCE05531.1 hypothetical protein PJ250_06105 [Pseudoxanthomonas sp. JBR18]